jgi:hypothetical protein
MLGLDRLRMPSRMWRTAAIAILAFTIGSAGVAFGLVVNGVVEACYNNTTGDLRIATPTKPCLTEAPAVLRETAISWTQIGPQGPKGDTGPQGPKGDTGPAGPAGGGGAASLDALHGLPCTGANGAAGTTRLIVADGNVSLFCDVPRPVGITVRPTFSALSVSGDIATVTFSEPICRETFFSPADWSGTINGFNTPLLVENIPMCEFDAGVVTANLLFPVAAPNGAFVTVTANRSGFQSSLVDSDGNALLAPQTRTATATPPETTRPRIVSATSSVGTNTVTLTFSEPVYCLPFSVFDTFAIHDDDPSADPVVTGMGSNSCAPSIGTADTSFSVTTNTPFLSGRTYTLVVVPLVVPQIRDIFGNSLLPAEIPIAVAPFVP